jgi:hypothetical protein
MVTTILVNRPTRLIFSTNTVSAAERVDAALPHILADIQPCASTYQVEHDLSPLKVTTEILVRSANISKKRQQGVHAFSNVDTDILAMADDTAIWQPHFL